MTIALKIGDKDSKVNALIFLDAVTSYSKNMSGRVTAHPIDAGADITDHYISQNRKFTLSGIITDVDITGVSDTFRGEDGEKAMNSRPSPTQATIVGQQSTMRYLPASVRQYFQRTNAEVYVDTDTGGVRDSIETVFSDLMSGLFYNSSDNKWRNKMTVTKLYEVENGLLSKVYDDLVITDISLNETAETGDAMEVSFSLERVRWATLDKTDMPTTATDPNKKKVASSSNKGKVGQKTGDESSTDANAPETKDGAQSKGRNPNDTLYGALDDLSGIRREQAARITETPIR